MPMGCMRRAIALLLLLPVFHAWADGPARPAAQPLGVQSPAQIVTDKDGIPHICARHVMGLYNGVPGARRWRPMWSDHRIKAQAPADVMRHARAAFDCAAA